MGMERKCFPCPFLKHEKEKICIKADKKRIDCHNKGIDIDKKVQMEGKCNGTNFKHD